MEKGKGWEGDGITPRFVEIGRNYWGNDWCGNNTGNVVGKLGKKYTTFIRGNRYCCGYPERKWGMMGWLAGWLGYAGRLGILFLVGK